MADTKTRWGAAPSHWALLQRLGLQADLLPTVCDPGVELSPKSKLASIYKAPGLINKAGYAVGFPAWTKATATDRQIGKWSEDDRLGICVQTRDVRAVDIDIDNPEVAREIVAEVHSALGLEPGTLPMRWRSNSAKCLLMARVEGPLRKQVINTHEGAVEFLGDGQQFVAVGTHKSGVPYVWGAPGGEGHLAPVALELVGIPKVPHDDWVQMIDWLQAARGIAPMLRAGAGVDGSGEHDMARVNADPVRAWLLSEGGAEWSAFDDGLHEHEGGKLDVRCPFEDRHSGGEAGDNSTVYIPQGFGGAGVGQVVCLHASCAGRHPQDFLDAMGYEGGAMLPGEFDDVSGQELPGVASPPRLPHRILTKGPKHEVWESSTENIAVALSRPDWLGVGVRYDEFKQTLYLHRPAEVMPGALGTDPADSLLAELPDPGEAVPFQDSHYAVLRMALRRRRIREPGDTVIRLSAELASRAFRFNSAQDWLQGLQWDGVPRVKGFARTHLAGRGNPEYLEAIGLYAWTAMAGRVMKPGCKADLVPVMVSGEGTGKSTAVRDMAPWTDAFVEVDLYAKDADIARMMRGCVVAELGELKGMYRRDAASLKSIITQNIDRWVPKYQENAISAGRTVVFWGTTNQYDVLGTNSGQRRWLPFEVGFMPWGKVREDRDQLWAEALVLWRKHGIMFKQAEALGPEGRDLFTVEAHPALHLLAANINSGDLVEPFTTEEARACVESDVGRKAASVQLVGTLLRELGYEKWRPRGGMLLEMGWTQERLDKCGATQPRVWSKRHEPGPSV